MNEFEPTEHVSYSSPRNEALFRMAESEWANESTGSDGLMPGRIWRMSNSEAELPELKEIFGDDWRELGVQPEQMLGHFMLGARFLERGGMVIEFRDEDALTAAFEGMKAIIEERRRPT